MRFLLPRPVSAMSPAVVLKCLILVATISLTSACDYYIDKINNDWSLCAIDDPDTMRLCRDLGNDSYHGVLEPVMVAWGFNGTYISLKRCFEGEETFYSVDATHTALYSDPPFDGPLTRSEWRQVMLDEPELWPVIDEVWIGLEKRHCPDGGEGG